MSELGEAIEVIESQTVVIYHKNCLDGFGAMWCARQHLGEDGVEYLAGQYGKELPDIIGKNVYLVDFSYKLKQMEELCSLAKSVTVLDHHKTAYDELADFYRDNYTAIWDMERSGAGIAHDYFIGTGCRHRVIDLIEDRDLWNFKFKDTKPVNLYLRTLDFDYDKWCVAMETPIEQLVQTGNALIMYRDLIIKEVLKSVEYKDLFGHKNVPVILNCPYLIVSEVLHEMDQNAPFACAYWNNKKTRLWSLRSAENGVDVSEIALANGGGGHPHASGMTTEYSLFEKIMRFFTK
jgi:oligoribonuclease NrnB/cAMP/cGMP phosphodiesterase (DHH superfamily)